MGGRHVFAYNELVFVAQGPFMATKPIEKLLYNTCRTVKGINLGANMWRNSQSTPEHALSPAAPKRTFHALNKNYSPAPAFGFVDKDTISWQNYFLVVRYFYTYPQSYTSKVAYLVGFECQFFRNTVRLAPCIITIDAAFRGGRISNFRP
ncbi:MAG: hypothetical protein IPL65_05280 [Lewinellaceae bacterium]|nr:hypothetical protein [Lewinellaceae bacterium]